MDFIKPNWHVIIIHAPLGLIFIGMAAEIICWCWRNLFFKYAARWMIAVGTFMTIPSVLAGVYAMKDVTHPATNASDAWKQITTDSPIAKEQHEMLENHMNFNITGTAIMCGTVFLALIVSYRVFRYFYALFWLAVLIAIGFYIWGTWHAGELIYHYGVGILNPTAEKDAQGYAFNFMQLHVIAAGFVVALAVTACALSIRRWICPQLTEAKHGEPFPPILFEPQALALWIITLIAGGCTIGVGLWIARNAADSGMLTAHLINAFVLAGLALLLCIIVGVSKSKGAVVFFAILFSISAGLQIYFGLKLFL